MNQQNLLVKHFRSEGKRDSIECLNDHSRVGCWRNIILTDLILMGTVFRELDQIQATI